MGEVSVIDDGDWESQVLVGETRYSVKKAVIVDEHHGILVN